MKSFEKDLPKILVVDDLSGREIDNQYNDDRTALCSALLLKDISTYDKHNPSIVNNPIAVAEFVRGQKPKKSIVGDVVENDLEGTLSHVQKGWSTAIEQGELPWAMVLLDLRFKTGEVTSKSHELKAGVPEGRNSDQEPTNYFGLELLDGIHKNFPELPVFMLSEMPRNNVSLEFSRRGALGFIDRDDLDAPVLLERALYKHGILPDTTNEIVGNSLPILLALREARRVAGIRENLLIQGERGTGKELFARYINRLNTTPIKTNNNPFVTVNSAVFTINLFASELFGIQPRTATGVDSKIGLIESANHGDLFFDEIADMPIEVQAAILRVLQEHRINRVGARDSKEVDVRFLSATNIDLENDPRGFRKDLLDRLRLGGTIWLPALRDRLNDIPLLIEKFVREKEFQLKGAMKRLVTSEVIDSFKSYEWPGNIRELRSIIFDAVNRHPDVEYLVLEHIRFQTGEQQKAKSSTHHILDSKSKINQGTYKKSEEVLLEDFSKLIQSITDFEFDTVSREKWAGRFNHFQTALAHLIAKYLKAALLANRKPTPDNPMGEILIHPAIKLLTGNKKITASKAADFIKRYLNFSSEDRAEILKDTVLSEAYEIALRLRPSKGTKKPEIK